MKAYYSSDIEVNGADFRRVGTAASAMWRKRTQTHTGIVVRFEWWLCVSVFVERHNFLGKLRKRVLRFFAKAIVPLLGIPRFAREK